MTVVEAELELAAPIDSDLPTATTAATDVASDRGRGDPAPPGAHHAEDHDQQPGGRHALR